MVRYIFCHDFSALEPDDEPGIFVYTGTILRFFTNKSVLGVSGPLFIMWLLAWTFTTLPEKHVLSIPLLVAIHISMGISMAGVTLAAGNIGLKLAPQAQAAAFLTTKNIINS